LGGKGEREVRDFRVGDRVIVKDNGGSFTTYRGFFKENGLTKWEPYYAEGKNTTVGEKYTIVATGKHGTDNFYGTLYLLRSNDGKIHIMNNNGYGDRRVYMELVEGERKLKTWEMIKALTDNPKLKFKSEDGFIASTREKILRLKYADRSSGVDGNIRLLTEGAFKADEWELVPQSITFTEAVKAAIEGKRPTIVLEGLKHTLIAEKSLRDIGYWLTVKSENGTAHSISTGMIDGMWTVE
jgi:hypothetical protein